MRTTIMHAAMNISEEVARFHICSRASLDTANSAEHNRVYPEGVRGLLVAAISFSGVKTEVFHADYPESAEPTGCY
jgi:hypothetical protein